MKRKTPLFLIIILLLGTLAGVYLKSNFLPPLFKITKIDCQTQFGPCQEDEMKRLEFLLNTNLISTSSSTVQDEIKKDFRNQDAYIQKILPGRIKVVIQKAKAFAAVKKENQDGFFVLSRQGVVIALADQTALPILSLAHGEKNLTVGQTSGERVVKAAGVAYLLNKFQETNLVSLNGKTNTVEAVLRPGTKVFFDLEKEARVSMGALQLLLASRTISGEKLPVEIDLRYSNAVVKY